MKLKRRHHHHLDTSWSYICMLEPNLSRTVASADVSGDLENHFLPLVNLLMAENEIKSLNRKTFKELAVSSFVKR